VVLPGGLWTNVPVAERFAQGSPYVLHREDGSYVLNLGAEPVADARARAAPGLVRPQDHHRQADDADRHAAGHLPGRLSREGLRVLDREAAKANCKFCSVGLNLGVDDADEKSSAR
jgi:hypothetical protein